MVPIVLLLDTMNYVPLAAILNLLKIDFFLFLLNSLTKFGQSIWAFLIIKLYGHYSASHVIWSLPHPSGHPGAKKNHFLRFHLITCFKVENPYWTFIYECCMDRILYFMYFRSPPSQCSPRGSEMVNSRFRTII